MKLLLKTCMMSEKLHEVYEVLFDGVVIYIGSGIQGIRHLHACSGKSHVPELNKLFFENPELLLVQVLREGLSKEESLELEKEYIFATQPKLNIVHTDRNKKLGRFGNGKNKRVKSFRKS